MVFDEGARWEQRNWWNIDNGGNNTHGSPLYPHSNCVKSCWEKYAHFLRTYFCFIFSKDCARIISSNKHTLHTFPDRSIVIVGFDVLDLQVHLKWFALISALFWRKDNPQPFKLPTPELIFLLQFVYLWFFMLYSQIIWNNVREDPKFTLGVIFSLSFSIITENSNAAAMCASSRSRRTAPEMDWMRAP